jgi:glycerophosphoryl diester phosphodiesterase
MGEINIFNFTDLLKRFKCKIYVESGTGIGVCLKHMLNYNFDEYHSIDLDPKLIKKAKENFKGKNIKFYNSFSTKAFKKIVPKLPKDIPVFFFLDAHFPDSDFNGRSYEESIKEYKSQALPLFDEIDIIKKHRDVSKDIFVIDDWKIYDKDHNYQYPEWDHYNLQNSLGINVSKDKILKFFEKTHNFELRLEHQGFLFIIPK